MAEIGLGLGANLGDRIAALVAALRALDATNGVRLTAVSRAFTTEPWGMTDQPDFLNLCALAETNLTPLALIAACQQIERALHRTTTLRWGPRTIDIDILFFDDLELSSPELVLPHPRMAERLFVLAPLADLCSDAPGLAKPIAHLAADLAQNPSTPGVAPDETATEALHRQLGTLLRRS